MNKEESKEKINSYSSEKNDEYREDFNLEKEKTLESKEFFEKHQKKIIEEKLEEELEKMEVNSEHLKEDIKVEREQIQDLKKKGKINRLLQIAQEKGVAYAIGVAKKMEDPYLIDTLHDILAHKGFYNKFIK
jgi:hypothetical protein